MEVSVSYGKQRAQSAEFRAQSTKFRKLGSWVPTQANTGLEWGTFGLAIRKTKARLVGRAFEMNRYYFQFIKLREMFGQQGGAVTRLFCVDWGRGYFGQGLTDSAFRAQSTELSFPLKPTEGLSGAPGTRRYQARLVSI
jgi:hypothetical protein